MLPPAVAALQFGVVGSTALYTDRYELTMLSSALRDGSAHRRCVFEAFTRRLPEGRRYGVVAGFASTSNRAAGQRYGVPTTGTAAHAFILLHETEAAAFRGQLAALGPATTLLVDTYDIAAGIRAAVEAAGPRLGAIRIDSGD